MSTGGNETDILKWAVGFVGGVFALVLGWIWSKVQALDAQMAAADKANAASITAATDKIWQAIDTDRRAGEAHRTRMLETLREVPTRSDLDAMEKRIVTQIDRQRPQLEHPRPQQ